MERDRMYRPNQIVAYNLRRLRTAKGWSQAQAVEALEPFLGAKWTGPNFTVAERYWPTEGQKVREFGADEIVAFAAAFEVGIDALFQPPPDAASVRPGKGISLPVDERYRGLLVSMQDTRRDVEELEIRARDLAEAMKALRAAAGWFEREESAEMTETKGAN